MLARFELDKAFTNGFLGSPSELPKAALDSLNSLGDEDDKRAMWLKSVCSWLGTFKNASLVYVSSPRRL